MQIRTDPNTLRHHGVKGMKWGVIRKGVRDTVEDSSKALNAVQRISPKSKKVRNDLKTMSDQELRAKINRMNMEQQYANLNPSRVARGSSYAKEVIEVAGGVAAVTLTVATLVQMFKENA